MFNFQPKNLRGNVLRQILPGDLLEVVQNYNMLGVGCWAFLNGLGW